jgi:uncharacterized protein YegP (UPF0339 family)
MPAEFEIKQNSAGQFYWRFKSGNGEIVAVSEAYASKQGCQNGINSIKRDASTATVQDLTASPSHFSIRY